MTEHKCSVCQCDFTDAQGGIHGFFGGIPVSFCPTCTSCFYDMAEQLDDREWVGLTDEEVSEIIDAEIGFNSCWGPEETFARAIEAKLKEKNT